MGSRDQQSACGLRADFVVCIFDTAWLKAIHFNSLLIRPFCMLCLLWAKFVFFYYSCRNCCHDVSKSSHVTHSEFI